MDLRLGDYREVLRDVTCNTVIVDAPYSAKTHAGHDAGVGATSKASIALYKAANGGKGGTSVRKEIGYGCWSSDDVAEFCDFWALRCNGWIVSVTDHDLAAVWTAELERIDRYVFAPLAYVAPGSRVRLTGDGPSNWTCWIVVARPKTPEFVRWGTLPGAYIVPAGHNDRIGGAGHGGTLIAGGKTEWLMRALVRDYSRPGDLVCDPCAGGGTTLLAAAQTGRRAVGAELSPETHAKALKRLANTPVTTDWLDTVPKAEQGGLW